MSFVIIIYYCVIILCVAAVSSKKTIFYCFTIERSSLSFGFKGAKAFSPKITFGFKSNLETHQTTYGNTPNYLRNLSETHQTT